MTSLYKQFVTLLLLTLLGAKEELRYTVNFWKIACAEVAMVREETEENNMKLEFSAKTQNVFDYFFSIDNRYITWYDKESFTISKYAVSTDQPNVDYNYELIWDEKTKMYTTSGISYDRPEKSHNIFSLLMRARNFPWQELDTIWWPVEHDGKPYKGRYLWVDSLDISVGAQKILADHFRLDLQEIDGGTHKLNEVSDIFSWGIILDDCIRQVWVERHNTRRILQAEVMVKGLKLKAKLKDE